MRASKRPSTNALHVSLYWIGVVSSVACVAVTFAGNTQFAWDAEHTGLPLSWILGLIAIVSFLAAEFTGTGTETEQLVEFSADALQQEA